MSSGVDAVGSSSIYRGNNAFIRDVPSLIKTYEPVWVFPEPRLSAAHIPVTREELLRPVSASGVEVLKEYEELKIAQGKVKRRILFLEGSSLVETEVWEEGEIS